MWLEFDPGEVFELEDLDEAHPEFEATWRGRPVPYAVRIPLVSASNAADVLGCRAMELEKWRRSVLPVAPRRFYGQLDDEYRHEEVLAVAVGRWPLDE